MMSFRRWRECEIACAFFLALLWVTPAPAGVPCDPPITADCGGPFNLNVGDPTGLLDPPLSFPSSNYGSFGVQAIDTFVPAGCGSAGTILRQYTISAFTCNGTATCTQVINLAEQSAVPSFVPTPPHTGRFCEEDTSPASTGMPVIPDLCGDVMISHTDLFVPTCGGGGTIFRTFTATDNAGNSTISGQQIITVLNRIPTIMAPPDIVLGCGDSTLPANTGTASSDACGILTISFSDAVTDGCGDTSTIMRTWTVVDDCGNSSSQNQLITVMNGPPVITCPDDTSIECGGDSTPAVTGMATATDDCGGATISFEDAFVAGCGGTGTLTRTWTATDECGLQSTCDQVIEVIDTTPPAITCPDDTSVECGGDSSPAVTGMATATDNCGSVTITSEDAFVAGCGGTGTLTRTWIATDECGLQASCDQVIAVIDTTPPAITCPADAILQCPADTSVAANGRATGSDVCGDVTISFQDAFAAGCGNTGVLTRTWTATDACGLQTSCDQVIEVIDTTPPDIACPGDITVECDVDVNDTANTNGDATATDNCDTPRISFSDVADLTGCNGTGTITRTWTATDACGNSASCDQQILVVDTTDPTITCPSPITVECESDIPGPDTSLVTASDNCTATADLLVEHVGDTALSSVCGGSLMRTYRVTDECGLSAECTQTITVDDTIPPVITCPDDVTLECGESTDVACRGMATATDNCEVDFAPIITHSDAVIGSCPDVTTIIRTWVAIDQCGNTDQCDQIITVRQFAHPGWNHVSTEIMLTKNEPTYWSAFSGQPKGVAPFTVLDPASAPSFIPGRPDPEGTHEWVLRGYIVGWAVDADNEEIRWNHLKGDAVIINYDDPSAWEYTSWAFPVVADVANGSKSGTPGVLNLDGTEYAPSFDELLLDFYAPDSSPFAGIIVDTDLTLHPVTVDLRQEDDGPVTTKARIDIWNENEIKFNGTERCITCWDQTLLRNYTEFGIPNSFLYQNLQTAKGRARIDGVQSDNCDFDFEFDPNIPFGADPRDIVSEDASLLGVAAKLIRFEAAVPTVASHTAPRTHAAAGTNLIGMGSQAAVVQYDPLDATPEAAASELDDLLQQILGQPRVRRSAHRLGAQPIGTTEGIASDADRVSGSEKGSLLIWSKVEIRWDKDGTLIQDTFIDVSNDFPEDVRVQLYFINGDGALEMTPPGGNP